MSASEGIDTIAQEDRDFMGSTKARCNALTQQDKSRFAPNPTSNSPLEINPHKAANGVHSITCRGRDFPVGRSPKLDCPRCAVFGRFPHEVRRRGRRGSRGENVIESGENQAKSASVPR